MTPRPLTSPHNPRLKLVRKLAQRRHRDATGLFVAEGPHLIEAALDEGAWLEDVVCSADFPGRYPELAARLEASQWPVWTVPTAVLRDLAATDHSQGVLCVAEKRSPAPEPPAAERLLGLALDAVADPGNVGTALRAAQAALAYPLLGPGCCDCYNAKAVRASAGAVFACPVHLPDDLPAALGRLRAGGVQVFVAAAGAGRTTWDVDLTGPVVLVVGNEARGVSADVRAVANASVAIPMPGGAESLNAGMAASVLLFEALRQRVAAAQ